MLDFVQRVMSAYLIHALVSLYPLTESLFEANRQSMVIVHVIHALSPWAFHMWKHERWIEWPLTCQLPINSLCDIKLHQISEEKSRKQFRKFIYKKHYLLLYILKHYMTICLWLLQQSEWRFRPAVHFQISYIWTQTPLKIREQTKVPLFIRQRKSIKV